MGDPIQFDVDSVRAMWDALPEFDRDTLGLVCGLAGKPLQTNGSLARKLHTTRAKALVQISKSLGRLRRALGATPEQLPDEELIELLIASETRRRATAATAPKTGFPAGLFPEEKPA